MRTQMSCVLVAAAAAACGAQPQWSSTTNLNPSLGSQGAWASAAYGGTGPQQVGIVNYSVSFGNAVTVASYWNGTAGSWVNLSPGVTSAAYASNGTQQVGSRSTHAFGGGAALWSGTAASVVNLHPAGGQYVASQALATSGSRQGGVVLENIAGVWYGRASLWSGSAASWVNLHPASTGQTSSRITGVSGNQQVGWTDWSGVHGSRAALWNGTAASYLSLHPSGNIFSSQALATNGGQQVGWMSRLGATYSAALWSGTAASMVDLHPFQSGTSNSMATGTSGDYQVGWVGAVNGQRYASLWNGTAASWVNLAQYLPGGAGAWYASEATGTWMAGNTLYVSGFARRTSQNGPMEAMVWEFDLPVVIPLPHASGLAIVGIGLLAARRRRNQLLP